MQYPNSKTAGFFCPPAKCSNDIISFKEVKTIHHESKISVRLGCIFYVVEIAYCQLTRLHVYTVPNRAYTFSQDAEINKSDFSTPIPRDKISIWCIYCKKYYY